MMLEAIARLEDTPNRNWLPDLVAETGLDLGTVNQSLRRLDGEYVTFKPLNVAQEPYPPRVLDVRLLPKARRAIKQWPSPEDALAAVVEALQAAADETEDPEEKSALRKAAGALPRLSVDVATNLVATFIAKASGMA